MSRPLVVTGLEEGLRRSLARQAAAAGPVLSSPDQLADQAIRRARRRRRRQRVAGAATTLVVVALVGLSVAALPERQPARVAVAPSTPASPAFRPAAGTPPDDVPFRPQAHKQARAVARLPVDLVAGDRLVTVDGSSIDLSFAGMVDQVYRSSAGWLVLGVPEGDAQAWLWYLTATGRRQTVLSDVDGVAFDPEGGRVAWRAGPLLRLGVLDGGSLHQREQMAVAGSGVPVGFVGDGVLMTQGRSGGYDVWWPHRAEYQPGWAGSAVAVYGALSDGRTAVGQVVVDAGAAGSGTGFGERRCLALFAAAKTLDQLHTLCGLGLGARSPGWVSPDGRWLVTGAGGRTVLVDLALTGKTRVISASPPTTGGAAWLDKHTLVLATSSGKAVVRLKLDERSGKQADDVQQWAVPARVGSVLVVPRFSV